MTAILSLVVLAFVALGALAAVLAVAGWIIRTVGDWWRENAPPGKE